jgi:hypothetical protein
LAKSRESAFPELHLHVRIEGALKASISTDLRWMLATASPRLDVDAHTPSNVLKLCALVGIAALATARPPMKTGESLRT